MHQFKSAVLRIDGLEKNMKGFDEYKGANTKRLDTVENTIERFDEVDEA